MAQKPKSTKDLLKDHFDGLRARKDARLDAVAPLQAELDALNLQIEALRAKAKDLADQIRSADEAGDSVASLDAEIAQVALALGAAKMSDGVVSE